MPRGKIRVAVVGGGIIGISSALYALESVKDIEVTVLAEELSPYTTGDGSAGFWNPYLVGSVDPTTFRFWCTETFNFLLSFGLCPEAANYGVGLLSAYYLTEEDHLEDPPYRDVYLHWRDLTSKELSIFPSKFRTGKFFTTLYAECTKLLPYMMKRFQEKGGKIVQRKVESLAELIGLYDAIINCPGVQASRLVPDPKVVAIRGQIIKVCAPWIKHAVASKDFYVLPNSEIVICGGLPKEGDWNTAPDPRVRESIWKGCCELVPSLKEAKIIGEWVGLRPGRISPRIERDSLKNELNESLEVIHNYGHGGSGVTLFWGCAKQAVALLRESIDDIQRSRLSSNL